MHVCATLGSTATPLREKMFERKSYKIVIFHVRGGALVQPIVMEASTFFKVINLISHANFGSCMLRCLVCANGRILAFPIGN